MNITGRALLNVTLWLLQNLQIFLIKKVSNYYETNFFYEYQSRQQLLWLTVAILLNNEKLDFVKLGPNFVGSAVIMGMIMKKQNPLN